jgi:hypothetical protein
MEDLVLKYCNSSRGLFLENFFEVGMLELACASLIITSILLVSYCRFISFITKYSPIQRVSEVGRLICDGLLGREDGDIATSAVRHVSVSDACLRPTYRYCNS